MTKASDNEFPSLLVKEGTAPSSPAAGDQRVYIDSTSHTVKRKNSSGTIVDLETGGAPAESAVTFTDITTNNASTSKHGYLKKLDNSATNFMNGQGAWAAPAGAGGVTVSENYLGADVTMTTANTFYDGPSLTLAAGTYVLIGHVSILILNAAGAYMTAKLWDGTTVYDDSIHYGVQFARHTCDVVGYVVLGGSTTLKISATQNSNGGTIETTIGTNGAANKGSHLMALKIA